MEFSFEITDMGVIDTLTDINTNSHRCCCCCCCLVKFGCERASIIKQALWLILDLLKFIIEVPFDGIEMLLFKEKLIFRLIVKLFKCTYRYKKQLTIIIFRSLVSYGHNG